MPTNPPTISVLPAAPDPSDRPSFNPRAYAWSAALPTFGSQIGAVATNIFNNATEAVAAAASATASAQSAVLSPGTSATSATSLTISADSKTLTIQTGKQFAVGQFVLIASAASPQNYMQAQITSHDSATGGLAVSVMSTEGSGTFASWIISLSMPGAFVPKTGGVVNGGLTVLGSLLVGSGALGYGAGAGGMAVQPIDKSKDVLIHRPSGFITMAAGSIAANGSAAFRVVNNTVFSGDTVTTMLIDGITTPSVGYLVDAHAAAAGYFFIVVRNITGVATPAGDTPRIQFHVHKGSRS